MAGTGVRLKSAIPGKTLPAEHIATVATDRPLDLKIISLSWYSFLTKPSVETLFVMTGAIRAPFEKLKINSGKQGR